MVHKETWRVTSDLVLMGFGGSVPGYQNGQQVWNGERRGCSDSSRRTLFSVCPLLL